MLPLFLDTSALVKRYVHETGSSWLRALTDPTAGNPCWLATLTRVELAAALYRRVRMGTLTSVQAARALRVFRGDLRTHFQRGVLNATVLNRAMQLVRTYPLRAYDALQLASVLYLHRQRIALGQLPLILLSADQDLNRAAIAEGLLVDDPNQHP